ncbi:uncharacterized protein [Elaeis guineensis]|uniref:Mitochondrial import inner membrane translocase subunit n=1 Tax=Elaeis guineensis var. tenera TaxID=51953 RepID=A0A6I9S015_ELAGV|nr:mitochondrial import inner membrane translocase subunit Tim13 isoform X3 [Elaeis guineensis]
MDPFSSPAPSNGSSGPSTEALMDQVKAQLAQAYAEEFLETVRSKCFSKCITKPGTGLSGSESSCISRCVERQANQVADYMSRWGLMRDFCWDSLTAVDAPCLQLLQADSYGVQFVRG